MNGQIVGDYTLSELVSTGETDMIWNGHHHVFEFPVRIRILKPEYVHDAAIRRRFLSGFSKYAQENSLQEGIQYQIIDAGDALYVVLDSTPKVNEASLGEFARLEEAGDGLFSRKGTEPPPPRVAELEDFHVQIQFFAKLSFVIDVLLGVSLIVSGALLAYSRMQNVADIPILGLLVTLAGLAFAMGALTAIGLLEIRKWAWKLGKIAYFSLFGIALVISFLGMQALEGKMLLGIPRNGNYLMLGLSFPGLVYSIWGLVLMYSKKSVHYFNR